MTDEGTIPNHNTADNLIYTANPERFRRNIFLEGIISEGRVTESDIREVENVRLLEEKAISDVKANQEVL